MEGDKYDDDSAIARVTDSPFVARSNLRRFAGYLYMVISVYSCMVLMRKPISPDFRPNFPRADSAYIRLPREMSLQISPLHILRNYDTNARYMRDLPEGLYRYIPRWLIILVGAFFP